VVKALANSSAQVIAMVRDVEKAKKVLLPLNSNVQIVQGDLEKPESYKPHLLGVSRVFILFGSGYPFNYQAKVEGSITTHFNFINDLSKHLAGNLARFAKEAGAKHVVKLSALGANASGCTGTASNPLSNELGLTWTFPLFADSLQRHHFDSEVEVTKANVPFTILRPHYFFSNFLGVAPQIKAMNTYFDSVAPDYKLAAISPRDIGLVAAKVLTDPVDEHSGRTYELTGPEVRLKRFVASL